MLGVAGIMTGYIRGPDLGKAIIRGVEVLAVQRNLVVVRRKNAFVNRGLQMMLDRAWSLAGAGNPVSHVGISGDSSAVTAATTTIGTPNAIKVVNNATRTNQTVATNALFSEADISFAMRKVALLNANSNTAVIDIIGGTGAAPYDDDLTLDLTNVDEWDLTFQVDVTLTAV